MFGLVPPPFPIGKPPSLKNEKQTDNIVLNVEQSFLPPNLNDPSISKERLAGRLQGSKSIYAMFGLPVPKWIEDGLDKTLDLPTNFSIASDFTTSNSNVKKPDVSGKGKGKGKGK